MDSSLNLPPLNVSELLRLHGLRPRQSLGQNFLVDTSALERVVEAADIQPSSTVLEVGPGLGSLTRYLARAARRVIVVELDANLIPILEEVLGGVENVEIVQGDILKIQPANLIGTSNLEAGYEVVANIPYYITSNLIRHLLESSLKPSRFVLTVQREVAERITASPPDMSLLSLSVQVYGLARKVAKIPARAFYPAPKVDSSVVRVDLYPDPLIPAHLIDTFFRLAKAGFSQKRKTLRNSLSAGISWPAAQTSDLLNSVGIDPQRRAETLSIDEWKSLTIQFAEGPPPKQED